VKLVIVIPVPETEFLHTNVHVQSLPSISELPTVQTVPTDVLLVLITKTTVPDVLISELLPQLVTVQFTISKESMKIYLVVNVNTGALTVLKNLTNVQVAQINPIDLWMNVSVT